MNSKIPKGKLLILLLILAGLSIFCFAAFICSTTGLGFLVGEEDNELSVGKEVSARETKEEEIEVETKQVTLQVVTETDVPFTRTPEIKPSETTVPTLPSTAAIPGLAPTDVKLNLEDRGFECSSVEVWEATEDFPREIYYRECLLEDSTFQAFVEIHGYKLFSVDSIQATVHEFSPPFDKVALPILGFIATMPYDGAEPLVARTWVEETIPTILENGDGRFAEFGNVEYQLFGGPGSRLLQIGFIE